MLRDRSEDFFETAKGMVKYYSLKRLEDEGLCQLSRLPYTVKVVLESILRNVDGRVITDEDVRNVAGWSPQAPILDVEVPFKPCRVLLQDFTGIPAIVDLAAMRDAVKSFGHDPGRVNPLIPVDLVVDHSVQVDFFGMRDALSLNIDREFERNGERYAFLKWAQQAFRGLRVSPPGRGIVHQVNLEYLARVVDVKPVNGQLVAFPDSVLGTDSHTPMVNGLGVLGWGVGGIEAEAVMLGQPYYMPMPEVVGVRLSGELPEGSTATDLVLTITEKLRKHGVVGKFVEFFGPGLKSLSVPDRATVANMAPEYGATVGFFPIDGETLTYLRMTGREDEHVGLVERYARLQALFYDDSTKPSYSEVIELNMNTVEPSIAGPTNPEDRIPLSNAKRSFAESMSAYLRQKGLETEVIDETVWFYEGGSSTLKTLTPAAPRVPLKVNGMDDELTHGSVVISAITSCTNTSNPAVMIGAGLMAKRAAERGLRVKPHVKASLAPGSRVVTEYLRESGLLTYLEQVGYHLVGYGCTTCIGNSGPLPDPVSEAIKRNDLYTVAVLSGNRNFEGRIHPQVRASFLMSPMLVLAYGLAGRMDINLLEEPLGTGKDGVPVFLRDIWPSMEEIRRTVTGSLNPEMFRQKYADIFKGEERWEELSVPSGKLYAWNPASTYIQKPPFFDEMKLETPKPEDILGARVLALLGDRVTTDHISPAGAIAPHSPAGRFLIEKGVDPAQFNTYGARRGNHEVMVRGTFANIRLRNQLVPEAEGWWTLHLPSGEKVNFYEASLKYAKAGTPLIILAGKQYGSGSSRDWAAKGVKLLGVKAVIAESFERIHRSNLVGMGVLPLQFEEGQGWRTLGLTGHEEYSITGVADGLNPRKKLNVTAKSDDGSEKSFTVTARLDTPVEVEYYQHGGILHYVLRKLTA